MFASRTTRRAGFSFVEILTVVGVIAILLSMGILLFRSTREAARVATAEKRLAQVSTGLELYFRDYHVYPPQDSDLSLELAEYVDDGSVFENPLKEEAYPGETLNEFYQEPTFKEIDEPGNYVVCYPGDDDETIVTLSTGSIVTRHDDVSYDADEPPVDIITKLHPPEPTPPRDDGGTTDDGTEEVTPPEEEPAPSAWPDDYTTESSEGVIAPQAWCSWVTFEVVDTELTWGEGGPDVSITVSLTRQAGAQSAAGAEPLFGGQPVSPGQMDKTVLWPDEGYALTFAAEYETDSGTSWAATYSSDGDPTHVLTLRNGDQPAEFDPYSNPVPVGDALASYVDPTTGQITIGDDQMLYLAELGSTSRASTEYDFQDAIVLAGVSEADAGAVNYYAVRDSSVSVKYEEGTPQLGEDGAQQTDHFSISAEGDPGEVQVTTKAGPSWVTSTVDLTEPGATTHDANGFEIVYRGDVGGVFTFDVSSVDNDHALSYVEFDFLAGRVMVNEGGSEVIRVTEAPMTD